MNGNLSEELEAIAKKARAIVPCNQCGNYDVSADDADAEKMAYAMATNAFNEGALRADSLVEVRKQMEAVLRDANFDCPECDLEKPD